MMHSLIEILPTVVGVTLALGAGGLIKGIISIGLPLISLPLLLMAVDIKSAIALLMVWWRGTAGFQRHAAGANVALMAAGLVIVESQITGFLMETTA